MRPDPRWNIFFRRVSFCATVVHTAENHFELLSFKSSVVPTSGHSTPHFGTQHIGASVACRARLAGTWLACLGATQVELQSSLTSISHHSITRHRLQLLDLWLPLQPPLKPVLVWRRPVACTSKTRSSACLLPPAVLSSASRNTTTALTEQKATVEDAGSWLTLET